MGVSDVELDGQGFNIEEKHPFGQLMNRWTTGR